MDHQSLTLQITSKAKKHLQNFEPAFFSEIPYENVAEINYLKDLEEKKQSLDFPIFEFEKDFGQQAPANDFDRLANTLYKKIMQQGYIQQKKAPSKKKKKTKNPLEYDYEDEWINDEEAMTVKKNIYVKIQNFKCYSQGIDDFYNSQLYKSSLSQIQQQSKKKTNEITMDAEELEEIKKKIKLNISIAHNRSKEQAEPEKPAMISDIHTLNEQNQETALKTDEGNFVKIKNNNAQDAQSVSGPLSDSKDNDSGPKVASRSSKGQNPQQKIQKSQKVHLKTKPVKKPRKSEKRLKEKPLPLADQQMKKEASDLLENPSKQPLQIIRQGEQNIQMPMKEFEELEIGNRQKADEQKQMDQE